VADKAGIEIEVFGIRRITATVPRMKHLIEQDLPFLTTTRTILIMNTSRVQEIANQIKSLPDDEREEFLSWLADYQLEQSDTWDKEIAKDSTPGGRLSIIMDRARRDIAEGRTRPIDEILGDT